MSIAMGPLIYLAIFGAVLLLVQAIYLLIFGKSIEHGSALNRRLELLKKNDTLTRNEIIEQLRKERSLHSESSPIPFYSLIADKAKKGNIAFSPRMLIMLMLVLSLVSFALMSLLTSTILPVRATLALSFGVGGVYFWVARKAKKRVDAVEAQLSDAIEMIVRSLRVGHPFATSLARAADEIPDPLGSELGLIADEVAYGRDVGEALSEFASRIGLQDLHFLAAAVTIQQTSGGNLAEILDGLSKVVRARFKLFRRVKAITAEARWSGVFLSGFPIAAMLLLQVIKPDYYDGVKETSYFLPLAIIVCVLLAVNILYMRKMTNIKV